MTTKIFELKECYVSSEGFRIHCLEWGTTGKEIIALHSMNMDAHAFDIFARSMAKDHRILAITLLSHGDSSKPNKKVSYDQHVDVIREVVKERGYSNPVILGHSIGGLLAMIYAAKYSNEVSGLILVDTAPRDPEERRSRPVRTPPPEFFESRDEALTYFKERFPSFTSEAYENRLKYGLEMMPDGKLRLKANVKALEMIIGTIDKDPWFYIKQIKTPTLLIIGANSQVVSSKSVDNMKNILKEFKVAKIEGATHMVPQDKPEEFEAIIRDFLK